jgi:hypothetical protein
MANMLAKVGAWTFIIGVLIAFVVGFLPDSYKAMAFGALVVIGVIVGFLNVTEKETTPFLMASVSVLIALYTASYALQAMMSTFSTFGWIGKSLIGLTSSINLFVFPATIVVAMKAIYSLAKDA